MVQSFEKPALKRKRSDKELSSDAEREILKSIKAKRDSGIWVRDIKKETGVSDHVVKTSLKSLLVKQLIKKVANIHFKRSNHYMAVEFEPSKQISGGDWYADGKLDEDLIKAVKDTCLRYLYKQKVGTVKEVGDYVRKIDVLNFEISDLHVAEILNLLVLENQSNVVEVKSTGFGEYRSIPVGMVCYRLAGGVVGVAKGSRPSAYASIPCGACPRISMCTPDGVISPSGCVYYSKWLSMDF